MNAVIGMSRILLDTELSDEQHHYLNLINDSGRLLVSIINVYPTLPPLLLCSLLAHLPLQDVLDFSKIEGGGLELEDRPFSLVDAVESSVHMCYDLATDRKLDIVYEFDPSCPSVKSLSLVIFQFYHQFIFFHKYQL